MQFFKIQSFSIVLIIWMLSMLPGSSTFTDNQFQWGTQIVVQAEAGPPSYYGLTADFTLIDSKYPFFIYLANHGTQLRSVCWENGQKVDELVMTLTQTFLGANVKSAYGKVYLILRTLTANNGCELNITEKTLSGWSIPELISGSQSLNFDLEIKSDGTPVVATVSTSSSGNNELNLWRRAGQIWIKEFVRKSSGFKSISRFDLAISNGQEHLAYREYSTVGTSSEVFHSIRSGETWKETKLFDGLLDCLFTGPSGDLHLIGGSSLAAHYIWHDGKWSEPESTPMIADTSISAGIANDGTIYAVTPTASYIRKSDGWSTIPTPAAIKVIINDLGEPNLFSATDNLISYHTPIRCRWTTENITEPDTTNMELTGIIIGEQQQPIIFAGNGANNQNYYQESNGIWNTSGLEWGLGKTEYAKDGLGRTHAFLPLRASYAVGQLNNLTKEDFPITLFSYSSSDIMSLCTDKQNNPHVSEFYYGPHNVYTLKYGTRKNNNWFIYDVPTTGPNYTRHTAVAVSPNGIPYVFAPDGLYRKNGEEWIKEFDTIDAKFPSVVISSDGTVHCTYVIDSKNLIAASGRDGNYRKSLLSSKFAQEIRPSMALVKDRPAVAFVNELNYYPSIQSIYYAEMVGNYWRQEITEEPISRHYAQSVKIAVNSSNEVFIASDCKNLINNTYYSYLKLHRRAPLPLTVQSATVSLSESKTGQKGFSMKSLDAFGSPLALQTSSDLVNWHTFYDLENPSFQADENITLKGNGFFNDLFLKASLEEGRQFVRILENPN